jgi:hypothetical protein
MLVSKHLLKDVVNRVYRSPIRGYDTETYGARYQDRLFSLIISVPQLGSAPEEDFYFNFNNSPDHLNKVTNSEFVLDRGEVFEMLNPSFYLGIWASHNAPFDNQKIRMESGSNPLACHCTLATERVLRNDFLDYTLEEVASRYGLEKDMSVDEYIKKHGLRTRVSIPGKKKVTHVPHYDKVPLEMMVKYGCTDAKIHRQIAEMQRTILGIQ